MNWHCNYCSDSALSDVIPDVTNTRIGKYKLNDVLQMVLDKGLEIVF